MTVQPEFYSFADLRVRGVVTTRRYLFTLQQKHQFPRPIRLCEDGRRAVFVAAEVDAWIAERKRRALASRDGVDSRSAGRHDGRMVITGASIKE